ncbi:MAG TPA: hypothetical protein VNM37_09105 [Candidatus Dormibacteraeota bacterium]|nr:hypothetical protein [Candidatus Dormibacteraeota bacterium]
MPFHKAETKATFRKITESAKSMGEQAHAAIKFSDAFRYQLGLCDEHGRANRDENGVPFIRPDATLKPREVSLVQFTEAILGDNWRDILGTRVGQGDGNTDWRTELGPNGSGFGRRYLSEADAGAIGPSVFMNIAAWSGAIAGLYAAQFIEGYNMPEYKARKLFPDRKAEIWQGGQRLIDVIPPYLPLPAVGPGEEAPSLKLDGMWVETAALQKYAGKIEIMKETAEVDISGGQFLAKARMAGEMAAMRENFNAINILIGTVNNFKLGLLPDASATAYNTYAPTINGVALPNDLVNPLNDVGAFQKSLEAQSNLVHPVSGWPIAVEMNAAIVPMRLENLFRSIAAAESTSALTQIVANGFQQPPPSGLFPTFMTNMDNPYRGMFSNVISDQWIDAMHKRSTTVTDPNLPAGLGLSDTNAYRWYRLNPAKFACRLVGWDLATLDLNPNDYVMATRSLIAGQVVSVASTHQVLSPWAVQRNKVA